jgi:hypothetical protein
VCLAILARLTFGLRQAKTELDLKLNSDVSQRRQQLVKLGKVINTVWGEAK